MQFVQTQRLLLAKRLLTDTALPITQIAMMSGFLSVRRFNTLFVERYRLNPRQLRKSILSKPISADTFICQLAFRTGLMIGSQCSVFFVCGHARVLNLLMKTNICEQFL